jgi:hypothetical protein
MFRAGAALQGAGGQDAPAAAAAINAISAEHGGEGLTEAIIAWCDTLTAAFPSREGISLDSAGSVKPVWPGPRMTSAIQCAHRRSAG